MNWIVMCSPTRRRHLTALVLLALGVGLLASLGISEANPDATAIAKEIEQLIRSAEKDTKAGSLAEAAEKLDRAESLLAELKDVSPRHRALRPMTARLAAARKHYEAANAASPAKKTVDETATTGGDAQADAQLMIDLYDTYYPKLDLIHGNSLVYGANVSDAQGALDQIEQAEALLPEFADDLGRLADTYGTAALEIGNNLHKRGVEVSGDPGGRLVYMIEAMEKVTRSRQASAETCVRHAQRLMDAFSDQITDVYLQRMDDAKKMLVIGQRLDPSNETIEEMLGTVDEQIVAAAETMQAQIDAATWAGNVGDFPGPGNTKALAAEALAFFRDHPGWGKQTDRQVDILDVCVRGGWLPAERDLFGRVISWRLPIHVAVTDPDLRPRNIARVYELSILAMEGAPAQAVKAPPFAGYWVGNSWMMRLDKF